MSRPIAIICARMGSKRLPGKTLMDIGGRPVLAYQLERVRAARLLDMVAVATSCEPQDLPIARFCADVNVPCFRGPESDVLERVLLAAEAFRADPVVRLTGDDPLADPALIDRVMDAYLQGNCDYASNVNPPTFPDGLDVEVLSLDALRRIAREARDPLDREHVTRSLRRNLKAWKTLNIANDEDLSGLHWALDEPEHIAFVRRVIEQLHPKNPLFSWRDVLAMETNS